MLIAGGKALVAQEKPAAPAETTAPSALDPDRVLGDDYPGEGGTASPPPSQTSITGQTNEAVAEVNTWDFINMILGLLVVVAIIYLIFYLLKKGMGKRVVENEIIKVLGSRILSGSKSLHLVDVGGEIYLVGSSNDSVNLISEIKDKETRDAIILAAAQTKDHRPPRFFDLITHVFKPNAKKKLEIQEGIEYMKKQRSRLDKLK
jgi:flagellar protein FliO/FliZ